MNFCAREARQIILVDGGGGMGGWGLTEGVGGGGGWVVARNKGTKGGEEGGVGGEGRGETSSHFALFFFCEELWRGVCVWGVIGVFLQARGGGKRNMGGLEYFFFFVVKTSGWSHDPRVRPRHHTSCLVMWWKPVFFGTDELPHWWLKALGRKAWFPWRDPE